MSFNKLKNLKGWPLAVVVFLLGSLDDFAYIFWLSLASANKVTLVICFVFIWNMTKMLYFLFATETWRDPKIFLAESLGSALGAGCSLYLFPMQ